MKKGNHTRKRTCTRLQPCYSSLSILVPHFRFYPPLFAPSVLQSPAPCVCQMAAAAVQPVLHGATCASGGGRGRSALKGGGATQDHRRRGGSQTHLLRTHVQAASWGEECGTSQTRGWDVGGAHAFTRALNHVILLFESFVCFV